MKNGLIFSLVLVTALALSLGAFLLPMASAVKADLGPLQTWLTENGYDIDAENDDLGIEMFEAGVYRVVIVNGEHGYANPTGWYTTEEDIHLIFPEPVEEGDSDWLISAVEFGFYIDSDDGRFFTQTALNGDGFDHALVFPNTRIGEGYSTGYIVAFEDLWGGGDGDYEDRILELWEDTDQDGIPDVEDNCPDVANPGQEDGDGDGVGNACDGCPDDPDKTDPGVCGCGVADTDSDGDGTADCNDGCPDDPDKTDPGACGCGVADTDSDGDGTADCNDGCPDDPDKTDPGACGCGVADTDSDGDGTADCIDGCPDDPDKTDPGACGCGVADTDSDGDGTADCIDGCPDDPDKTDPGVCGCGVADTDSDGDGTADCNDGCPDDPDKTDPGVCGCGVADTDSDGDGTTDCNDNCPTVPNPSQQDQDTDGVGDACDCDADGLCTAEEWCGTQGTSDPDCAPPSCTDADQDGYSVEGGVCGPVDCDDNNPSTYPGAPEICDGKDNDCDSAIDEGGVCPPPPVGGTILPTDKTGLVMPWIMASALIVVAGMSLAVWNKKRGAERLSDH